MEEKLKELYEKSERKKNSSPIHQAFMEDENIRKNSERRSLEYLNRDIKKTVPTWAWFVTGIFTGYLLALWTL
jgi:hypothetical protein